MVAITVLEQLIALFLIMFVAFGMTKKGMLDGRTVKGLSTLLLNAALPAMVLGSMQVSYSPELLRDFGLTFLGMVVCVATSIIIVLPICMARRVSLRETGIWMSCTAFPNSIFMGKPIMLALFGDGVHFPIAALIYAFNILCFSVGVYLIKMGGEDNDEGFLRLFVKSLRNPVLVVGAVGFFMFLFSVQFPAPVQNALQMLGDTVTPISMIIIGFSLGQSNLRELFGDVRVYLISGLRLLVSPVLTYFIMRMFLSDPVLLGIMTVSSAMPVGSMMAVLSEQHDNNPLLASKTVFVSTLLCIVTAPLVMLMVSL